MLLLTATQQARLSINPRDAKGNAASVDGAPVWTSSDPAIVTVQPAVDGLSADVIAVGPAGTAQISVQADADLGVGVVTLTGTLDLQVVGGQAVTLGITTSAPIEQS